MASRLQPIDTAFSLSPTKQKRPRLEDGKHLNTIRSLPCVVCLRRPVEAAHIRSSSRIYGKREAGIAEKPSDQWCLPLCPEHHREQHRGGERAFYSKYGIEPFGTALALWAAKDDSEAQDVIIRNARKP